MERKLINKSYSTVKFKLFYDQENKRHVLTNISLSFCRLHLKAVPISKNLNHGITTIANMNLICSN